MIPNLSPHPNPCHSEESPTRNPPPPLFLRRIILIERDRGKHGWSMRQYYVYIMSNMARVLYVGVTNHLARRVYERREALIPGFTSRYRLARVVYWEATEDVRSALEREKEIKAWRRSKKLDLITQANPFWEDMSLDFLPPKGQAGG